MDRWMDVCMYVCMYVFTSLSIPLGHMEGFIGSRWHVDEASPYQVNVRYDKKIGPEVMELRC
jgi:hypothetical protein